MNSLGERLKHKDSATNLIYDSFARILSQTETSRNSRSAQVPAPNSWPSDVRTGETHSLAAEDPLTIGLHVRAFQPGNRLGAIHATVAGCVRRQSDARQIASRCTRG